MNGLCCRNFQTVHVDPFPFSSAEPLLMTFVDSRARKTHRFSVIMMLMVMMVMVMGKMMVMKKGQSDIAAYMHGYIHYDDKNDEDEAEPTL